MHLNTANPHPPPDPPHPPSYNPNPSTNRQAPARRGSQTQTDAQHSLDDSRGWSEGLLAHLHVREFAGLVAGELLHSLVRHLERVVQVVDDGDGAARVQQ